MSARESVLVALGGSGNAIMPMISGDGFVLHDWGGTAISPMITSEPRRAEHPTSERTKAQSAPPSFASRARTRRSRDGQSVVNIVPSARRWNRPQNFPSFSRTRVSICTRVIADRLKTCLEHCPQKRARSSPSMSFQRARHGEATRISSTLIVIFIRLLDVSRPGMLPEVCAVSNFPSTFALTVINVSAACLPKRNLLP